MATLAESALVGGAGSRQAAGRATPRPAFPRGWHQPALRLLSHARLAMPAPGAMAALARRIAAEDLVVDLGDRIGSGHWWRGAVTLVALCGAAITFGVRLPPVAGPVPAALAPSAAAEVRALGIGPIGRDSPVARQAPPTPMARRLAEPPERPRIEIAANVGAGGLEGTLRRSGVGRADLDAIRAALPSGVTMASVPRGSAIDLVLGRRPNRSVPRPVEELSFRAAFDLRVEARRASDGTLAVRPIPIAIDDTPLRVTGEVGRSLERALRASGLPASVVADYLQQMRHVLDLQREVGSRDRFEVVIAHRRAETGETEMGRLLYAGLVNGGDKISLMRWGPKGEFWRANGEGARRGLMRTPVSGARLSSGFGMRFHPILNYSRMHQGIDFAAPTGTPVVASAAGRVQQAGWGGGYGNMVTIDHGNGVQTRYAHLHRMNVRVGQQVTQGQQIGQVGSTGLSTGPHLHYEVWQNGRPVDPRSARFLAGNSLPAAEMPRFRAEMARLRALPAAGRATEGRSDG